MNEEPADKARERVLAGLAEAKEKWGFVPSEELPPGHCSRVFARDDLVLKVIWQGEELTSGMVMAKAMSGGIGPLVYESGDSGLLLMERVRPGLPLHHPSFSALDDLEVFFELASQVPRCARGGLTQVEEWHQADSSLRRWLVQQGAEGRDGQWQARHGDLHHENILWDGDGWKVIDPKGVFAGWGFECCAILRNPLDLLDKVEDLEGHLLARIERLSALTGVDPAVLLGWSLLDQLSDPSEANHPWGRCLDALLSLSQQWPKVQALALQHPS
jgi:hypothetical protein